MASVEYRLGYPGIGRGGEPSAGFLQRAGDLLVRGHTSTKTKGNPMAGTSRLAGDRRYWTAHVGATGATGSLARLASASPAEEKTAGHTPNLAIDPLVEIRLTVPDRQRPSS